MTTLEELCDRALGTARRRLADETAEAHARADIELGPVVEGFRGNQAVIVLFPHESAPGAEEALRACWLAATAFACDTITMTTDTYMAVGDAKDGAQAKDMVNPLTGKPWGRGDMQELAMHHRGVERGWITEALMTLAVNRAGDTATATAEYKLTERKGNLSREPWVQLEWGFEHSAAETPIKMEGRVVDNVVRYMNHPTIAQIMARAGLHAEEFGLTYEQALAHMDCAAVKYAGQVLGFQGAMLLSSDNEERSKVIDESLAQPGAE